MSVRERTQDAVPAGLSDQMRPMRRAELTSTRSMTAPRDYRTKPGRLKLF